MKRVPAAWKKDKKVLLIRGLMLLSALAAVGCFVSCRIIGAEVLSDGTLVEPFALILIGYLFVLAFIVCLILNLIFLKKRK